MRYIRGMKLEILQDGNESLRRVSEPLPERLFGTPELQKMLDDMKDTVDAESDGVAIAAPQVGIPYRMFLVRYDRMEPLKEGERMEDRAPDVGVFINPKLTKLSRKASEVDEGCLSVRGTYGETLRKERATIEARDENGIHFTRGAGGLLAQAFQHEVDHLDGVLFVDHALKLWKPREAEGRADIHE